MADTAPGRLRGRGPAPALGMAQQTGIVGGFLRFWQMSYTPDYVGITLLIVVYIIIQSSIEPFHRMFALDDHRIQYPYALVERVPLNMLLVYGALVPIVVIAAWAVAFRPTGHKIHVTYLGLVTSVFLTVFLTDFVKNAVGRPRPDLIDRCKPKPGLPTNQLVTWEVCTQTNHHTLHDGFRSFPSGHSSWSFSGLGYLAMFLASQLHTFSHPPFPFRLTSTSSSPTTTMLKYVTSSTPILPHFLLPLLPLLGALAIALSRLQDYRHDPIDVTCGSILGFVCAYINFRRYYPRLNSRSCEEPWPSRGGLGGAQGWQRGDVESLAGQDQSAIGLGLGYGMGDGENDTDEEDEEGPRFLRNGGEQRQQQFGSNATTGAVRAAR